MAQEYKLMKTVEYKNLSKEAQEQLSSITYFPTTARVQEDPSKDELSKDLFKKGVLPLEKVIIL